VSKEKKGYYDEAYAVKNIRKNPLPKLASLSNSSVLSFQIKVVFESLSPGEKLLDVGCGGWVIRVDGKG